ncbi:MAG TPA: UDP-N-acetylmuramate dehydrogenase [Candidatus Paceibacterota bacterium]
MEIKENTPLAPLTTFRIGGPARWLVEARNQSEIKEAVLYAHAHDLPFVVLSGGSNVLVPDEGLHALVIHVLEGEHAFTGNALRADAGCNLLLLIKAASALEYGGWEKLSGIPGSIGGAVRGNAGAFGTEIKDVVTVVRAMHRETLESRSFVHPYMAFAYRDSTFKQNPEWIITNVTVELLRVERVQSKKLIEDTIAEREKRHLQNVQAAGSFFMNPVAPQGIVALFEKEKKVKSRESRVPAGWLIEKAGLKGATVGGAIASDQHPNYLVNTGNATAKDVLALAAKIKDEVKKQFNVDMHEEAAII